MAKGWENTLGERLARALLNSTFLGQRIEMADIEFDFPWLPKNRRKISFELRELAFEIVPN